MDAHEDAILQLLRLALKGDTSSLERYANRLMRRSSHDDFRRALSELLVTHAGRRVASRRQGQGTPVPAAESSEYFTHLPKMEGVSPTLPPVVTDAIERLLRERSGIHALKEVGLEPTRSVLLVGPPGVGKTMTAGYLAERLGLPLFSLDLVSVMSSLLGQSGQNIRRAIDHARSTACVFLLDEIDAIAKRRDDATDVGELKRVVNLLLLELDRWPSSSLLIAATNHPELLDRALWRRFDMVLEIPLPDESVRELIVAQCLERHGGEVDSRTVAQVARVMRGASGADLALCVRGAVREAVLADVPLNDALRQSATLTLARAAAAGDDEVRAHFCRMAHDELRLTQREIGALIGVSHVTVGKILRQQSGRRKYQKAGGSKAR